MKGNKYLKRIAATALSATMTMAMAAPVMADTVKTATPNDTTDGLKAATTGLVQATSLPAESEFDTKTDYLAFLDQYKAFDSAAENIVSGLDQKAVAADVITAINKATINNTTGVYKNSSSLTGSYQTNNSDAGYNVVVTEAENDTTNPGNATLSVKLPYSTDNGSTVKGVAPVSLSLEWGTKVEDAFNAAVAIITKDIEGNGLTGAFGKAGYKTESRVAANAGVLNVEGLTAPTTYDSSEAGTFTTDYTGYAVAYSDVKAVEGSYVPATTTAAGQYKLSVKIKVTKTGSDGSGAEKEETKTFTVPLAQKTSHRVHEVTTDSSVNTATTVWTSGNVTKAGVAYPIDVKVKYQDMSTGVIDTNYSNTAATLADAGLSLSLSDNSIAHLVDSAVANTGKALVFDRPGTVTIKYTSTNYWDEKASSYTAITTNTADLAAVTLNDNQASFQSVLDNIDRTVTASEVPSAAEVKAAVKSKVQAAYDAYYGKSTVLDIDVENLTNFNAAVAGTAEDIDGTDGSFYVSVAVDKKTPNVVLSASMNKAWTITADKYTGKFTDVKDSDYFSTPVYWGVENNIVQGTTDTTFSPKANVTRAQFVTFLYRQAGSPDVEINKTFTDISGLSTEFQKAISWAAANGVTDGVTDTTFAPNATVNREQAVTFLFRYTKGEATTKTASFKDVDSTAYYADAVNWGAENGVVEGYNDDTFGVGRSTNRGEAITFIYRALAD